MQAKFRLRYNTLRHTFHVCFIDNKLFTAYFSTFLYVYFMGKL